MQIKPYEGMETMHVVEFISHLEDKQQIIPNTVMWKFNTYTCICHS